jgi:hypothetical protein
MTTTLLGKVDPPHDHANYPASRASYIATSERLEHYSGIVP